VLNPARPESNVTGFTNFYEYGVSGKWLALLKEIAPSVSRVATLQNPNHPSWVGYQGSIAKTAPLLGVQPIPARVYTPADIDSVLDALAREPNGGLLVLPDTFTRFIATESWLWLTIIACLRCTRCGSLPLAGD